MHSVMSNRNPIFKVAFLAAAGLALLILSAPDARAAGAQPSLSEIRIDQPGSDTDEYLELQGPPGASLDGLTYLVIGDGSGGSGVIEAVIDLSGQSIPASGFFVVAESSFSLGTADLVTSLNFENSDNVTHMLVAGFTGSNGDDLDTDDDGTLDVIPWSEVLDSVALIESPGSGDQVYSDIQVGPDGPYVPAHVFRCIEGWQIGAFNPSGGQDTPGAANACEPVLELTIMEIQGSGDRSPYEGDLVSTTGVVTLTTPDGYSFWIQDPAGDGDPSTSDGILVYGAGKLGVSAAPGDLVRVVDRVVEYRRSSRPGDLTLTEFSYPLQVEVLSSGNPLPEPVELTDLPDESIVEGIAFWEPLEGMRVQLHNAPVVAPTSRYGEFAVLTRADAQPGSGYYPQTKQILLRSLGANAVDYNPERILVDDSTLTQPIIVRPGDKVRRLIGVVDYTFGNYKLQPETFDLTVQRPPRWPVSKRSGPRGQFVITTFNVENLFDLVDEPGKDDIGTGGAATPEELETLLNKLALAIVVELRLPDILVVQEVENTAILQELGDRVNAAVGTDYRAISFETSDGRGIEVGFLWDANRVTLVEAYQLDDSIVPGVSAAFGPSSPSPGREPLVGIFEIAGQQLTIVGNHLKSKRGDDPLFGVNQPPVRISEVQRKAQARVVRDFVNLILDADPEALVIVAGDMNDFEFGEPGEGADHPLAILEGGPGEVPLTNLVLQEKKAERFTFVFDGNSQVLDHILVSPAALQWLVGADILHFNASYPAELGEVADTPLRASDHDPVEARFGLRGHWRP